MTCTKILVANRGEIARRIFRTCREMGISTVAVHSQPDSEQPHVAEADESVLLPGAASADTYLNIDAILAAAKQTGADAVHPGYGFLAESAPFAQAVIDAGLTWIGPSPRSIEVMGSKLESKRLMEGVGVPILAGFEVTDEGSARRAVETTGFPVLVKASAGGGGKGMRIVSRPDELWPAVESARREAEAAFGDDTVFVERYMPAPRHIEIQVLGDVHGTIISLGERECSIQRRHQKIIEESPSPVIDQDIRFGMNELAIKAASAVDYIGAGTVELLYQEGSYFFLEMNTRLQVEHPVTEMVTGWDLVRLQIELAQGAELPSPPPAPDSHAIEARLYAEDPLNGYAPSAGTFHRFSIPPAPGVRVDSAVEDGSVVSVHYDPMVAKVIACAGTREEAASLLASTLRHARLHGPTTNRDLLVRILEHPDFVAGDTDTHFLQRHNPARLGQPLPSPDQELLAAVATALADQAAERAAAPVLTTLPAGWRNSPSQSQVRSYAGYHGEHRVTYNVGPDGFPVQGLGTVVLVEATPDRVTLTLDGVEHHNPVARYGAQRYTGTPSGEVHLTAASRFPDTSRNDRAGSLHAPMPGKVIRLEVEAGDPVEEGQPVAVLEAMKMEHTVRSPVSGTVSEVRCGPGDQVVAGDLLVVVEEGG